jgi:two-component system, cell cycle sensor histidine kinase and response regulator CckA
MSSDSRSPSGSASTWSAVSALLDAVGDVVCGLDDGLSVAWLNAVGHRASAAYGIDATAAIGRPIADILPPSTDPRLLEAIRGVHGNGGTATLDLRLPASERDLRVSVVRLPVGVALVVREVTDARALQRVQEVYESRYRTLFDAVPLPLVVFDRMTARVLAANAAALEVFGGVASLIGTSAGDLVQEEERERFLAMRATRSGTLPVDREQSTWQLRRADGESMAAEVTTLDLDFEGQSARLAMIRDVTAVRQFEEEKLLLRTAISRINDLLVITRALPAPDGSYPIVFVNEAFERQTGWRREEVLGRSSTLLDGPGTDRGVVARIQDHLRRGESAREEVRHYTKEGREYWVELVIVPVYDADGVHTHWVAVHRDISERKALEEQLFQAQKMEAVGRLAGGVAHDFNNVLTAISGFSELLLDELPAGEGPHEEVLQIKAAAARAAALTRQLLAFSRKQIMRPRPVNVGALVRDMERLLQRVSTAEVSMRMTIAGYSPAVQADPVQLEQVLLNLAVNACEAMPNGGQLTIEVSDVALGESYAHRHYGVQPGHYVSLVVTDTGTGMDRVTRERIFEPFFTTKQGGTGLGLSTVYGIIRQTGGHIWVYSEPGVGTTFKIYLPVGEGETSETVAAPVVPEVLGGTETILVVEDEALVRDVTRAMLERRGYQVLVANDGEHALRVASEYPGPIALVLTDVIMPRANGRWVADHLRVERPEIRVLYMSGYTEDTIVHHGVLETGITLLEKPFTEQALSRAVRQRLDDPVNEQVGEG